jgi:predicted nucleic acid-binding protein
MLLLDTSAASAFMHRRPHALLRLSEQDPSTVYLCAPVAAEIHFGLSRLPPESRRRRLLANEFQRLLAAVRWIDWNEAATRAFGQWKATLQRRGTPIEDMDLAIASIALGLSARLATANIRHFERIDDLAVVDWSEPEVPTTPPLRPRRA